MSTFNERRDQYLLELRRSAPPNPWNEIGAAYRALADIRADYQAGLVDNQELKEAERSYRGIVEMYKGSNE